jgi:hypothetical protein
MIPDMSSFLEREVPLPRHNHCAKYLNAVSLAKIYKNLFGSDLSLEVSTSNPPIKLQVLLRREWRTSDGIEQVRKILTSIGLKPTASGLATISAEAEPERFESLFGVKATEIAPRGPGKTDFGTSGGHESAELAVPAQLAQYVQSISAAPPHAYLER